MRDPNRLNHFRSPSTFAMIGVAALLVGIAATAALDHIDSYRLDVIGRAPCTKRALSFEPFETVLSWTSLASLAAALLFGVAAVASARSSTHRSSALGPLVLVVVTALMLTLAISSQMSPFDFDDSMLPMCGASGRLGRL